MRTAKTAAVFIFALAVAGVCLHASRNSATLANDKDHRIVKAERKSLQKIVRRTGVLTPVKEEHIVARIGGQILEIAPQGTRVSAGDVVLRLDPSQHEENKVRQEGQILRVQAEADRQQAESSKTLNQAQEDVLSYDLRVELEKMRLEEIKKGPSATDAINADANLENSKNLLAALEEELQSLSTLLEGGFISKAEHDQKKLDVLEQRLRVSDAEIARRKLYVEDKVKIAEQQLKVQDALKTRNAAADRVSLLKRNIERDHENNRRRMDREQSKLKDYTDNIAKTISRAPANGVVLHKKTLWYAFTAGSDVWDGIEVMSLPDYTRMKVVLAIDEGRIGDIFMDKPADIMPAGWPGKPLRGKVIRIAGKGRDEFASYLKATTDVIGEANRQVFEVEVEIEGDSMAFRPGSRAEVSILVQTADDAIVIPRMAVFRDANGDATAHVFKSGAVEVRKIKVLLQNDAFAAVEGVNEGEEVWILDENEKQ
jgi:multidrug efflux pump subunit AcrA (membrane-fusion protein)